MRTFILLLAAILFLPLNALSVEKVKQPKSVKTKKLSKQEQQYCANKPLRYGKTDYEEMKQQWNRSDFFFSDAPLFFVSDGLTALICGTSDYVIDAAYFGPKEVKNVGKWTVAKSKKLAQEGGRMITSTGHTVNKAFKKNPLKNTSHHTDDPNSPFNNLYRTPSAE